MEKANVGYFLRNIEGMGEARDKKEHEKENSDKENLLTVETNLIRLEYPGMVKNVDKALATLGGLNSLEKVVAGEKTNLELSFHPENRFNKPCLVENDASSGILIRVPGNQQCDENTQIKYEVIGATKVNFSFNKLCDFQYLPVLEDDEHEIVYEQMVPDKVPDLKWFLSEKGADQKRFTCPSSFARFDAPNNKLYLNAYERFNLSMNQIRPEVNRPMNRNRISTRNLSKFVSLLKFDVEIPVEPLHFTMQLIKERGLEVEYERVKKLFEERPIWTKAAVQYKLGLSHDPTKILLPSVGYFCNAGPWRMLWIKFGYNPTKDPNSRIYQTLDYRIRPSEGLRLKVDAKRKYTREIILKRKVAASTNTVEVRRTTPEEKSFILRPPDIPPARQMFYQYCDIHLPAIQEMLQKLPKVPSSTKFNSKNGWFPPDFTFQCREIVNNYVVDKVRKELVEDMKKLQQHCEDAEVSDSEEEDQLNPATYCSKMLSNIKRGIYNSVRLSTGEPSTSSASTMKPMVVDTVTLLDDNPNDGEEEELDLNDVVNCLPERMDENSDEELSQCSEFDIDMEALEEVNEIVGSRRRRSSTS